MNRYCLCQFPHTFLRPTVKASVGAFRNRVTSLSPLLLVRYIRLRTRHCDYRFFVQMIHFIYRTSQQRQPGRRNHFAREQDILAAIIRNEDRASKFGRERDMKNSIFDLSRAAPQDSNRRAVNKFGRGFTRSKPTREGRSMNVGSCNSGTHSTQALQHKREAAEVQKGGRDNDGDADDSGVSAAPSTPSPSVNLNGQKVGQVIDVSA